MRTFFAGFEAGHEPVKVTLGRGARRLLARELEERDLTRAVVLTTAEQAAQGETLRVELGSRSSGLFAGAKMHTPVETTEAALAACEGADCLVALGGGSTIGLSKALALRTGLPQIVLPTTYAGSEATPVLGQTSGGRKETLRSAKIQPNVILYDPELVVTLPASMTVTSGLNAMAHAVEALYARDANPLSDQLAIAGLRTFRDGLAQVVQQPNDLAAREATLFGSWLCGTVLAQVGMSLHHKLCHTLGGLLNLPHADTHAVLLPHTAAYNADVAAMQLHPAAELFGGSIGGGLYDFAAKLRAPSALSGLGVAEADLDRAADLAVANPYWNPRTLDREGIRELLQRAWSGARPA